MYSGELEVQAKRKAVAVLQDEINRILNAGRSLSQLPELIVKKEPENILAWHLKGISHNLLVQPIRADLSAAEEFFIKRV